MSEAERIKRCISLVTEEEVAAALTTDKGAGAHITSWSIEEFTQRGDNYASVVVAVKVDYALEGEAGHVSYIVKISPGLGTMEDSTHVLFEKEVEFFQRYLPRINGILEELGQGQLATPKWYHASLKSREELVFLEDLRPQGFKMMARQKGLTASQTLMVLRELAKLHAASMLMLQRDPDCLKDSLAHRGFTTLIEGDTFILDLVGGSVDNSITMLQTVEGFQDATEWLAKAKIDIKNVMEASRPEDPKALCHGDCWTNNFLFRYDESGTPVEVRLIDLQIYRYGSVAVDITYMFYTSLSNDVRRPNIQSFVDAYRTHLNVILQAGGSDILTKDQLAESLHTQLGFGALQGSMSLGLTLASSDEVPDTDKLVEGLANNVIKMFNENGEMRSRFLAMFEEFRDQGLYKT